MALTDPPLHLTLSNRDTFPMHNDLTFKEHIADIKQKCTPKLRALKAITGQEFGQRKERTTTICKQFIIYTAEYCKTSWSLNLSDTHYKTLQVL